MSLAWFTSEVAWLIAAWFCALVAIGLIVYALFGDRARGRKRCPGCWYDLTAHASGTYPVRCPECGRESKRERDLGRNRVRFGYIGAAMAILVVAYVASVMERTLDRGAIGLAPTPALVLIEPWAVPSEVGGCTVTSTLLTDELLDRQSARDFWPVWGRLWAWRTGLEFDSENPDAPVFAGIDLASVCEAAWGPKWEWTIPSRTCLLCDRDDLLIDAQQQRLLMMAASVPNMVDSVDWTINGGALATIEVRGRVLMLAGPRVTLERAETLLRMCRENTAIARTSDNQFQQRYWLTEPRDIMVISVGRLFESQVKELESQLRDNSDADVIIATELERFADDVGIVLSSHVDIEGWAENGGDRNTWTRCGERIIISCPRKLADELELALRSLVSHVHFGGSGEFEGRSFGISPEWVKQRSQL